MATKAEIDAKYLAIHNRVSAAFYALPKAKQALYFPLFTRFHTRLVCAWDVEAIANGVLVDFWLDEKRDEMGNLLQAGTKLRSQEASEIVALVKLSLTETTQLRDGLEASLE